MGPDKKSCPATPVFFTSVYILYILFCIFLPQIIHNCRGIASTLNCQFGVKLTNVFDTQVCHKFYVFEHYLTTCALFGLYCVWRQTSSFSVFGLRRCLGGRCHVLLLWDGGLPPRQSHHFGGGGESPPEDPLLSGLSPSNEVQACSGKAHTSPTSLLWLLFWKHLIISGSLNKTIMHEIHLNWKLNVEVKALVPCFTPPETWWHPSIVWCRRKQITPTLDTGFLAMYICRTAGVGPAHCPLTIMT